MINSAAWLTLPQLARLLEQHSQNQQTGSFIGISDSGESLLISVQKGTVVGLSLKTTVGAAALPAIRKSGQFKIKFKDKLVARADTDLPVTQEIIDALTPDDSPHQSLAA